MTRDAHAILEFREVVLLPDARPFSLSVVPGDTIAIMGPAGAGKSRLVRAILQEGPHSTGVIDLRGAIQTPKRVAPKSRRTPMELVSALFRVKGPLSGISEKVFEVLQAAGLESVLNDPIPSLSPGQVAACELVPLLRGDSDLLVIDGHFDRLDPWVRTSLLDRFLELCHPKGETSRSPAALLVSTQLPEVAETMGHLLLLTQGSVVSHGPVRDFCKLYRPDEITVETDDGSSVMAMAEPFALKIEQEGRQLKITTHEGQALAARLLAQGYGRVRTLWVRESSLSEALWQAIPDTPLRSKGWKNS